MPTSTSTRRHGSEPGQTVTFPEQHVPTACRSRSCRPTSASARATTASAASASPRSDPGRATVDELVRPPTDLLDSAGASSLDHRLALLFTRLRSNPAEPVRTDEETCDPAGLRPARPPDRSRSAGAGALSAYVPDDAIDQLLGLPDAAHGGITASSEPDLPGSLEQRARPRSTATPPRPGRRSFAQQTGQCIDVTVAPTRPPSTTSTCRS